MHRRDFPFTINRRDNLLVETIKMRLHEIFTSDENRFSVVVALTAVKIYRRFCNPIYREVMNSKHYLT